MVASTSGGSGSMFLTAFGGIYVAAFVSFWLQYPGTLGSDGLLPVDSFWPKIGGRHRSTSDAPVELPWIGKVPLDIQVVRCLRQYLKVPCILCFKDTLLKGLDADTIIEGAAVLGTACGCLALLGIHNVLIFAVAFLCYLSCFIVGQTWLGFQWDIFLLETGASIILYAPWWSLKSSSPQPAAAWVLRAQFVKFMLMSGVVKVTANCPTWRDLTALEYHFASTCLPTSEAWIHHSLPPFLLRCGVAVMFLLEVIAPWLLILPVRPLRQVGVLVQIPLQIAIMLTGNYNWFNLHTMILLLPAWEVDVDVAGEPLGFVWFLTAPFRLWERAWQSRPARIFGIFVAIGFLTWSGYKLFPVTYSRDASPVGLGMLFEADALRIENKVTQQFTRWMLDTALREQTYLAFYVLHGMVAVTHALSPPPGKLIFRIPRCMWRLVVGSASMLYLGVTLLPMNSIHRDPPIPFKPEANMLRDVLHPFHVSSSYGLFRRMTGVGSAPSGAENSWGGLPPSVVEVPAVVVEGKHAGDGTWKEIPFRYAPYKPRRAPRRTAPHQPRLDWQMWFAALGAYQHNPWFVHLIWKLLIGSREVIQLLDIDEYPFKDRPPSEIRASLYHYDFTRLPSPWAERQPKGSLAKVINATRGSKDHALWWSRKRVREYFPTVSAGMLLESIERQGWKLEPSKASPLNLFKGCSLPRQRVRDANTSAAWIGNFAVARHCEAVMLLRHYGARVRSFVGCKVDIPIHARFWSGASTEGFLDGPLLVISAVVAAPLCLRVLLVFVWAFSRMMFGVVCHRGNVAVAWQVPGGKKLKGE